MNLFKKKKTCISCDAKIVAPEHFAEVRYKYTDEDGLEGLGVAYICAKCTEEIESQQNMIGDEDESV